MTLIRRTSTPSPRSSRQRYAAFASSILPDRISLPMRTIPAVFGITVRDCTLGGRRLLELTVSELRPGPRPRRRAGPHRVPSRLVLGSPDPRAAPVRLARPGRSEEHTSELQSLRHLVCRLLLE